MVLAIAGCGDSPLGSCGKQKDLSGHWTISAAPVAGDAGVMGDVVPRSFIIDAELTQVKRQGTFSLGSSVWGTLTSRDKGVFGTLTIPQLTMNNGSKTGGEVGCEVQINVPVASPVTDDNTDQGPLRITLAGNLIDQGKMLGDPDLSEVIFTEDSTMTPRHFAWTATQP